MSRSYLRNRSALILITCFHNLDNIVRRILNPQGMEVRRGGIYLIRLEISVTLLHGVFHTSTFGLNGIVEQIKF